MALDRQWCRSLTELCILFQSQATFTLFGADGGQLKVVDYR